MPVFRNDLETRTWGYGPYRSSYKIIDANGRTVDFPSQEVLLFEILLELKKMNLHLESISGENITDESLDEE